MGSESAIGRRYLSSDPLFGPFAKLTSSLAHERANVRNSWTHVGKGEAVMRSLSRPIAGFAQKLSWVAAAVAVLWAALPPSAAATTATFNFDADVPGTLTPFADTNNGVTATFGANFGGRTGSQFMIVQTSPGAFSTLSGNVLNAFPPSGIAVLHIAFSELITGISVSFVQNPSAPIELSNGFGGLADTMGTVPPGFFSPKGPFPSAEHHPLPSPSSKAANHLQSTILL